MIAIIGAGITGLALGEYLQGAGIPFHIFEAGERVGGNIYTESFQGYQLEYGPNSLRMTDALHTFLSRIGVGEDLLAADKSAKSRFVLREGKYRKLPSGPVSFILGGFFSLRAKRAILREGRVPAETPERESVDAFFRRRFGAEVADYAAGPFVSGIFAGDAEQLLMEEAFPEVKAWEMEHGAVIRGAMRSAKNNTHKGVYGFREGLFTVPLKLAERLGKAISLKMPVTDVFRDADRTVFRVGDEVVRPSAMVFTTPAHVTAKLLDQLYPEASRAFSRVHYPPVSVVHTMLAASQFANSPRGFGALHNHLETTETIGNIFSSSVFPHRAPEGKVLLTSMIGGARYPEKALQEEGELKNAAWTDIQRFLGATGTPELQKVVRWERAIPQYDSDILPSRAFLQPLEKDKIYLGGNWIGGISVPNCIQRAKSIAEKIAGRSLGN